MLNKSIVYLCLVLIILFFSACGNPAPDVSPSSVNFNLTVDPDSWVTVPSGEFLSGLNEIKKNLGYDYQIMVTEVTYQQYCNYLNQAMTSNRIKIKEGDVFGYYKGDSFNQGRHEMKIEKGDYKYYSLKGAKCRIKFSEGKFEVEQGYEIFPVTYVTWFGARAYAQFNNFRLPTTLEWEKAARGTDGRCYPFVEEPTPKRANYYKSKDPFDSANGTTPVGFYNGKTHGDFETIDSPSPFGCYDMAGNAAEWMGDILEGSHLRIIYGGSMMEYQFNLRSFTENSGMGDYASFQVGFRCVRDCKESAVE